MRLVLLLYICLVQFRNFLQLNFPQMSRYARTFFTKLKSIKLKPIHTIPLTTSIAATTFTTGHDYQINPNKLEKTLEKQQTSSKTTSNNFEKNAYNEMESNFNKTQQKLSNILSTSSNISFSNTNNINKKHSKSLPLNHNLIKSNWNDFYIVCI